jgi:hypothetical protein
MIYRASDLGLIDALEFRRAYKEISVRHWRKEEPGEPPVEQPEVFAKAMRTLAQKKGTTAADVAHALYWTTATFEGVTGWMVGERTHAQDNPAGVIPFSRRQAQQR